MTLPRYSDHQSVIRARRLMALGLSLGETGRQLGLLSRDLDRLLW